MRVHDGNERPEGRVGQDMIREASVPVDPVAVVASILAHPDEVGPPQVTDYRPGRALADY
jgi:hypothetical protein